MARSTQCADTGNGAAIACSAGVTRTIRARNIVPGRFAQERIDCSELLTSGARKYLPSDLFDLPELEVEETFDTFDPMPAVGTSLGTVTITWPLRTGETTPATLAGTAYLSAYQPPRLANGEIQVATWSIQWNGATPPAFTPST